jgi:hypothetical protein
MLSLQYLTTLTTRIFVYCPEITVYYSVAYKFSAELPLTHHILLDLEIKIPT